MNFVKATLILLSSTLLFGGFFGCAKSITSSNGGAESEVTKTAAPPQITTFIFAERSGSDTLILLDHIKAEGYLRTPLPAREISVPPNNYRLSFLSPNGDTIAQAVNPSTINERLESPQPDGSINSVEVELEEGVFTVRTRKTQIDAILVERAFDKGPVVFLQRIAIKRRD